MSIDPFAQLLMQARDGDVRSMLSALSWTRELLFSMACTPINGAPLAVAERLRAVAKEVRATEYFVAGFLEGRAHQAQLRSRKHGRRR